MELTKRQKELQEAQKAFKKDLDAICEKHEMQLMPIIQPRQDGALIPSITVIEALAEEPKKDKK